MYKINIKLLNYCFEVFIDLAKIEIKTIKIFNL